MTAVRWRRCRWRGCRRRGCRSVTAVRQTGDDYDCAVSSSRVFPVLGSPPDCARFRFSYRHSSQRARRWRGWRERASGCRPVTAVRDYDFFSSSRRVFPVHGSHPHCFRLRFWCRHFSRRARRSLGTRR